MINNLSSALLLTHQKVQEYSKESIKFSSWAEQTSKSPDKESFANLALLYKSLAVDAFTAYGEIKEIIDNFKSP